ncbi:MAG: hypothetical protein ABI560_02500 [Myxococcales bacterium]
MMAPLRNLSVGLWGVGVLTGVLMMTIGTAGAVEPSGRVPAASATGAPTGAGGSGGGGTAADAPKVKVERGAGGKKIYRITEDIRIEGKIQKPEAFFFYQKSSINYDWQEMKQDFVPRILESVNRAPF